MQWIGKGVLPIGKNILHYGDVVTQEMQKVLGKKRIKQFQDKGKIGEVPMAGNRTSADDFLKLEKEHENLASAFNLLNETHKSLLENNEGLMKVNDELTNQVTELTAQVEELTK